MNEQDVPAWIERLATVSGGFAVFFTGLGAGLLALWKHGYNAGRRAERDKQVRETLRTLAHDPTE